MRRFNILLENLVQIEEFLSAFGLGAIVFLGLSNVFSRVLFHYPFGWHLEVSLIIFIYSVLLGVPVLYRRGRLIRMDLLKRVLNGKSRQYLELMVEVFILIFLIIVIVYSAKLCWFQKGYISRGLNFPRSFVTLALPLSGVLTLANNLYVLLSIIKVIISRDVKKKE